MPLGSDDCISDDYFKYIDQIDLKSDTLYFPTIFKLVSFVSFDSFDIIKVKKTRLGLWLRYANPGFGFGWICSRKSIEKTLTQYDIKFFGSDYIYATDTYFLALLSSLGYKFNFLPNPSSTFFYGASGPLVAIFTSLF